MLADKLLASAAGTNTEDFCKSCRNAAWYSAPTVIYLFCAQSYNNYIKSNTQKQTKREVNIMKIITKVLGSAVALFALFYVLVLVTAWI